MTKQLSEHAQAAKAIRQIIKGMGLTAKVKAKAASMTSSVSINLLNATPEQVEQVKQAVAPFECGSFDVYQDLYQYDNLDNSLPQVKYIFVSTEFDDSLRQKALDALCELAQIEPMDLADMPFTLDIGYPQATYTDNLINRVLSGRFERIDIYA